MRLLEIGNIFLNKKFLLMEKKILYIINESYFFLSHKKELADKVKKLGYQVHVAVPRDHVWAPENFSNKKISERGFICHEYDLSRRGENIFFALKSFFQILLIIVFIYYHILTIVRFRFFFNKEQHSYDDHPPSTTRLCPLTALDPLSIKKSIAVVISLISSIFPLGDNSEYFSLNLGLSLPVIPP